MSTRFATYIQRGGNPATTRQGFKAIWEQGRRDQIPRKVLRSQKKRERKERGKALAEAIGHIFDGSATEQDAITVVVYSKEFERPVIDTEGDSVVDLTEISPFRLRR